ncbi:IS110 family transposase [Rothia kristinae]
MLVATRGRAHRVGNGALSSTLYQTRDGTPLPQTEPAIRDLLEQLRSTYGSILVIVDQPKTIGTLAIAVATSLGVDVAYLPGLTMRRVADLHPGQAKTDARDAFIIAETARTMLPTLRGITVAEQSIAELLAAVRVR